MSSNSIIFCAMLLNPRYRRIMFPGRASRRGRPNALPGNIIRPYRGFSNIAQNTTEFEDTYHSIQSNFNRRFRNGFSFGVNYVLSLSFTGNTGLQKRLQHAADGSFTVRADQAGVYKKLNEMLNLQRHLLKANWVSGSSGLQDVQCVGGR